jgi:hypothetical protein
MIWGNLSSFSGSRRRLNTIFCAAFGHPSLTIDLVKRLLFPVCGVDIISVVENKLQRRVSFLHTSSLQKIRVKWQLSI